MQFNRLHFINCLFSISASRSDDSDDSTVRVETETDTEVSQASQEGNSADVDDSDGSPLKLSRMYQICDETISFIYFGTNLHILLQTCIHVHVFHINLLCILGQSVKRKAKVLKPTVKSTPKAKSTPKKATATRAKPAASPKTPGQSITFVRHLLKYQTCDFKLSLKILISCMTLN